jgi:hypothetical protein
MTDNTNTYGLYSDWPTFWPNLTIALDQDISTPELLELLAYIEHKDASTAHEYRVIDQLRKELKNKEPNELPNFELLKKLSGFKNRLTAFEPKHVQQYDQISMLLRFFETETELHLIKVYTKEEIRPLRFPGCWVLEQPEVQVAMARLKEHSEEQDEVLAEAAKLWNELLDLWLKLPVSTDEVENFRKAVTYVKAGE